MTTTDTTPRIVCPSWCDRTQEDHLESLEAEADHQPWHRSNDVKGDGWRVFISGFSTLDGGPVNERGSCPDVVVEAEVWTAQDTAQLVAAIQRLGGHLEA
jgi:hypothetical protein